MERHVRSVLAAAAAVTAGTALALASPGAVGGAVARPQGGAGQGRAPAHGAGADRPGRLAAAMTAASGARLWVARYNGPAKGEDRAAAVAVSPDGATVFVTGRGYNYDGPLPDMWETVAYRASTGARLWVATYKAPWSPDPAGLAVSPDGSRVFVSGEDATVAYSASAGAQLWAQPGGGPLAVSHDASTVFVHSSGGVTAYAASTGARVWAASDAAYPYYAAAVASRNGMVYVVGRTSTPSTGDDYATAAYSAATGALRWFRRYNGPGGGEDDARSLAVSPNGSMVFVTGHSNGGTVTRTDYATVAYNAATGAQVWVRRYNGRDNDYDSAAAVSVARDSSKVFVTGFSVGDYLTLAYRASDGARLWARSYDGPRHDEDWATSVVSPGNGKVYVTGNADSFDVSTEHHMNYATVAYSARTGARLWTARYYGPFGGPNAVAGLAATKTQVFVTGTSLAAPYVFGEALPTDYATVAYQG